MKAGCFNNSYHRDSLPYLCSSSHSSVCGACLLPTSYKFGSSFTFRDRCLLEFE
jgi:hypothetical protein